MRSAADDVELEIRLAADEAPDDPSFWDRLGALWSDVWHGASDVAAEAGNGLLSWGNAALHHPDMLLEIAAGLALVAAGAEGVTGGGALVATGVGAPEGIVLAAAGAAAVVAGSGLLLEGFGRLSAEASGDSAVSPLHGAARGGGSGSGTVDAVSVRSRVESVTKPGRSRDVRVVEDETRLRELFDELGVGGRDVTPSTGACARNGKMVDLDAICGFYGDGQTPGATLIEPVVRELVASDLVRIGGLAATGFSAFDGGPEVGLRVVLGEYRSRADAWAFNAWLDNPAAGDELARDRPTARYHQLDR